MIVLATLAAYANSFQGVFVFDDDASIVNNPTIRHLWPIWEPLSPPRNGETVSGRPLLNFSLAVNYAMGGTNICGYHAVNLAIHILAALVLFGVLRRTLQLRDWRLAIKRLPQNRQDHVGRPPNVESVNGFGIGTKELSGKRTAMDGHIPYFPSHTPFALAVALLWAVHPLQTGAVTYVIQRAQSLASLFYLLVLYCVIRGATLERDWGLGIGDWRKPRSSTANPQSPIPNRFFWYLAAVVACALGMATKETAVTAPLLVLLYDRTFLSGRFSEALRRRWALYVALAATWGLLAYLAHTTGLLVRRAEFESPGAWSYVISQPRVILYFLWLGVWPHPLCLDGACTVARNAHDVVPAAIVVTALLAITVAGLIRGRPWAFVIACFFLLLSPTCSVVPLGALGCQHWMYLPLAAVLTILVAAAWRTITESICCGILPRWSSHIVGNGFTIIAALPLVVLTLERNRIYSTELAIWQDTAAQAPWSARAHNNLGTALHHQGRLAEAITEYQKAAELKPEYGKAYNNWGAALFDEGRYAEAVGPCRQAVRIAPQAFESHSNLANALNHSGQYEEAIGEFQRALQLDPTNAAVHNDLAIALTASGRTDEAICHYRQALKIDPRLARVRAGLGNCLYRQGKVREAVAEWRAAACLQPFEPSAVPMLNFAAWHLATCPDLCARDGAKAVELAERAAALSGSSDPAVLDTLAAAYAEMGRFQKAAATAERARQLAVSDGQTTLAERIAARWKLYQSRSPYHDAGKP